MDTPKVHSSSTGSSSILCAWVSLLIVCGCFVYCMRVNILPKAVCSLVLMPGCRSHSTPHITAISPDRRGATGICNFS